MALLNPQSLQIAIQKSGRLTEKSIRLLAECDINFEMHSDYLIENATSFPAQLLRIRNADVLAYMKEGLCDLAVLGENTLIEEFTDATPNFIDQQIKLPFGNCRLSLAVPTESTVPSIDWFSGKRIATSYPNTTRQYFKTEGIDVEIVEIQGSVEIATQLGSADAICDIVSTGITLQRHNLREFKTILKSQAVILTRKGLKNEKNKKMEDFLLRIKGVTTARGKKYIMLNAPLKNLEAISALLPGMESPTIIPLKDRPEQVAIHSVALEQNFWTTLEKLKELGANSILVMPIEKMIL
jgi:ATP phosphoribosyltransferase